VSNPIAKNLERLVQKNGTKREEGFSLLELMTSLAILLVIAGAIFSAIVFYQKSYQGSQLRSDLYFGIQGASELISQEVGQAGSVGLPLTTISGTVTGNGTAQTVTVSQANYIFAGEQLLIDAGANEELVSVTAVSSGSNTITGIFTKNHAASPPTPVTALGVFSQGVLSSSTATSLKLFGDINGDGTIYYVEYNCDTAAGTLTRSSTPITASSKNAPPQTLLDTLTANPGGTPCFAYTSQTSGSYTFITSVGLTLSLQSSIPDLQTGAKPTMTKTFMNLSPRNILAGLELAGNSVYSRLQPTPPNVPLP
jgi:prepilin-type N-terminal cleavage/methylation domain-containing protein